MAAPCLDFEDDDDEGGNTDSALKLSDLESNPLQTQTGVQMFSDKGLNDQDGDFNMDKYFSNGDVERKQDDFYEEDNDDDDDGYGRRGKANEKIPSRYLDDYGDDKDDDDLADNQNQQYSIAELDGWMNQVNEKMKRVEEIEAKQGRLQIEESGKDKDKSDDEDEELDLELINQHQARVSLGMQQKQ